MKRDDIAKWYVKKPIPVQAIQWTGDNFAQIEEFAGSGYVWVEDGYLFVASHDCTFKTQSKAGDYIVRAANGDLYICKKSSFEATYEEAQPTDGKLETNGRN